MPNFLIGCEHIISLNPQSTLGNRYCYPHSKNEETEAQMYLNANF